MLELLGHLNNFFQPFNLFNYITVRAGGALITAFLIGTITGPWLITKFRAIQHGTQTVRDYLTHQNGKKGTPTMGGVLIMLAMAVSVLLWANLTNPYTWLLLATGLSFSVIGLADDYCKIKKLWHNGVPAKIRLALMWVLAFAVIAIAVMINPQPDDTMLYLPFIKQAAIEIGLIGLLLVGGFVMVGSANAVNITDGLDGLVSIPAAIVALTLAVLAYVVGRVDYTEYLAISHIPGAGEITVVMSALVGAILAFLWYNAPPARIFMGDTGSLPIGAMLGAVAVIIKQEFAFAVVSGLFVVEALSSIIQVISYKTRKKRIFKMAPLHHHFEQIGWPESTIVVRFWIVALLLAMIGLATLKLR